MGRFIAAPASASYEIVGVVTNTTASAQKLYLVDTTGGPITLTIPDSGSAVVGERIVVVDPAGTHGTYPCTVGTTTATTKIAALNDNLLLNIPYNSVELLYSGASYGWVIVNS